VISFCLALEGAVLKLKIFFFASGLLAMFRLEGLTYTFRYLSEDLVLSKILLFLMLLGVRREELS
jgi:hypothetical protein